MRKILFALLVGTLMFSCSSDEETIPETITQKNNRLIIGTWKLTSYFINDVQQNLNSCQLLSKTTYSTAPTMKRYNDDFYNKNSAGDCFVNQYENYWNIEENVLYRYDGNLAISHTLVTLSETTLKYSVQGNTYTFTKQ